MELAVGIFLPQHEQFHVAVVACLPFRAVPLISSKPNWIGACVVGLGCCLFFMLFDSLAPPQFPLQLSARQLRHRNTSVVNVALGALNLRPILDMHSVVQSDSAGKRCIFNH